MDAWFLKLRQCNTYSAYTFSCVN